MGNVTVSPSVAGLRINLVVPAFFSLTVLSHQQWNQSMIQRFGKGIDGDSLFKGYVTTPPILFKKDETFFGKKRRPLTRVAAMGYPYGPNEL